MYGFGNFFPNIRFKFQKSYIPAEGSWASHITPLYLGFITCKTKNNNNIDFIGVLESGI